MSMLLRAFLCFCDCCSAAAEKAAISHGTSNTASQELKSSKSVHQTKIGDRIGVSQIQATMDRVVNTEMVYALNHP